jgi:hypothetical protein
MRILRTLRSGPRSGLARWLFYFKIGIGIWLVFGYLFQDALSRGDVVFALIGTAIFSAIDAFLDRNQGYSPTRRYGPRIDGRDES